MISQSPFPLPPLSRFTPTGTARRLAPRHLGLETAFGPGFSGLASPKDHPLHFPCDPDPLENPRLAAVAPNAAALLGRKAEDLLGSPYWAEILAGSAVVEGADSYATAYSGHQFGVFVPRLGDGRALNLGALRGWELQLKGAGMTPYARHADGRAVIRSSIREFLCSEHMAALGIPTTRALSLVVSDTPVMREQIERAAVVCRLAPSFLRFGHFEYFATQGQIQSLQQLIDHFLLIEPNLAPHRKASWPVKVEAMALHIARSTAELMAEWSAVGFMHGVMNTDNFSALGLTIDYGPFGFMERFEAGHICNHSDHGGRYAFDQQPTVGLWNVQRLLIALVHAIDSDPDGLKRQLGGINEKLVDAYKSAFSERFELRFSQKLGIASIRASRSNDVRHLLSGLFEVLETQGCDFTRFFRATASITLNNNGSHQPLEAPLQSPGWQRLLTQFSKPEDSQAWLESYQALIREEIASMGSVAVWQAQQRERNPSIVLRNWIAEEVIRSLEDQGDADPLQRALRLLTAPFDDHPEAGSWQDGSPEWAGALCVSCSS